MFLYIHFKKNAGLVASQGFHKEDKLASFVMDEIRNLITSTKNDYGHKNAPDSKEVETFLQGLYRPNVSQLKELIVQYEKWATPFAGAAIIHDIQEHSLIKDSH